MKPSHPVRRIGALGLIVLLIGALAACSDVGDNTGLGGGQDGAADGTISSEGGEAGDAGMSTEAASEGGGEDAGQGSETGSGQDGSGDGSPVAETGGGNPEGGADAPSVDSTAPETGSPETGGADAQLDGTIDAGPDSSAHGDAGPDASHDAAADGSGTLVPCTTAGQTGCVRCRVDGGVCTPTEALLVQRDIDNGVATAPGPAPADPGDGTVCYTCALNAFCLDNPSQTGFECGDLSGNFTNGAGVSIPASTACIHTLACITGATGMSCVTNGNGIGDCYCGPSLTPTQCATATTQNGPCLTQEIGGFAYTPGATAANTILSEFTTQTQPSGNANALANCAASNLCSACIAP